MRLTRDTSEEVKTMRQFIDPKTEDPLLLSDISKFMEFGGTKIKFTSDEVRATQKSLLWGSFGLKLICFKQQSQLRWSDFVRSSNFIYPDETVIKGSRNLFSALLNRCQEKNVIPICRLVALISNFIVRYYKSGFVKWCSNNCLSNIWPKCILLSSKIFKLSAESRVQTDQ